jgi:nucleoside-diphosphate-sugar epimerase
MKNIILSGSTGFIGSNISKMLISSEKIKLDSINLRKNSDEIEKEIKDKHYDVFIHSAGVHPFRDRLESPEIFSENKKILQKVENIFKISKKVILISSFVNLINFDKKTMDENNKIYTNKDDNFYKKSKYSTEKYFNDLQNKYKNELIILYPCHVIGPEDHNVSPNGYFFKKTIKKKINYYFDILYPLTDVREISNYVDYIIKKDLKSHKKIIINASIKMSDYIKKIKNNDKGFINIKIYKIFYALLSILNITLNKIHLSKKIYFPFSTYKYLMLDPKIISSNNNQYINKYIVDETISDTLNFFKNYE